MVVLVLNDINVLNLPNIILLLNAEEYKLKINKTVESETNHLLFTLKYKYIHYK